MFQFGRPSSTCMVSVCALKNRNILHYLATNYQIKFRHIICDKLQTFTLKLSTTLCSFVIFQTLKKFQVINAFRRHYPYVQAALQIKIKKKLSRKRGDRNPSFSYLLKKHFVANGYTHISFTGSYTHNERPTLFWLQATTGSSWI